MWFPGQLQAWMQSQIVSASFARCANVDYPCRYNPKADKTFFRTRRPVQEVKASGDVVRRNADGFFIIEVDGKGRIPALFVPGTAADDWEASLDGKNWNLAESDPVLRSSEKIPDEWNPLVVELKPRETLRISRREWIEDFRYIGVGQVSFMASGHGVLAVTPGETMREVKCDDAASHEQFLLTDVGVSGENVAFTIPARALRFLRFRVKKGNVSVSNVVFRIAMESVENAFSFRSDDPALNRLFDAGLATVHSSMGWGFHLDGLKRDYLPWSMDAALSVLAATWCFENRQIIRNDISIGVMPPEPMISDLGAVEYPLHAMFAIEADYRKYRDLSTFRMFRDRLESQFSLYESMKDANGFISAPEKSFFGFLPSWSRAYSGPEEKGVPAYAQMILRMNYALYARFLRRLGEESKAAELERRGEVLAEAICRHFWDGDRGAFVNGYRLDGSLDRRISHHTQYWAVLAGLFPPDGYRRLFDEILPAIPRYETDISYEKGYELLAYVKVGRAGLFRERFLDGAWRDWLDQGHTSFPEHFSMGLPESEQIRFYGRPFGRSLCHGTNGMVPVLYVLRGALGFREGERDGEYFFTPDFTGKATRYDAKLRVREGWISIVAEKGRKAKVEAPEGVFVLVDSVNLNGARWLDDGGKAINAHGGGIIRHGGRWWWFGEDKGKGLGGHKARTGVHAYSSENLSDWRDEGIALRVSEDSESEIKSGNTIERPKVLYCAKTGKFVMYFHLELEGKKYTAARTGIAVADAPAGPYRFVRSLRPLARCWPHDVPENLRTPETLAKMSSALDIRTYRSSSYAEMPMFGKWFEGGQEARDQTLFLDDDGKAYHIYASEGNATLHVAELTDDFLGHTGRFARLFPAGFNEAPAICKRDGRYYMIASDCTGWKPNACRAYVADNIFGPWREAGNPCRGVNPANGLGANKTWGGQSTFILKIPGAPDRYIAMFDEWRPQDFADSRYFWLPVSFGDDGRMTVEWKEEAAK